MTTQLALLSIDIATIIVLSLYGLRVILNRPRSRESGLTFLLCVATVAHVALSRAEYAPWMPEPYRFAFGNATHAMNIVRNLTPGLFALLTCSMFADRRRQPPWLYGLLAIQAALEVLRIRDVPGSDLLSALLQIAFAAFSIYWTVGYWRVDLVEARRRKRAVVSIILGINVVASTLLLRLIIPENQAANYHGHIVLSVATLGLVVFLLFRLMNGEVHGHNDGNSQTVQTVIDESRPSRRVAAEETRRSEDSLALKRLEILLQEKRIHSEPGLSLKRLADRVGLPEYRLRQLIHEHLRFRNFNSFLHAYRVRDAIEQLSDPERRDVPILSIAQSVGYESLNTFNRGFREVMDTTPSEYRERVGKSVRR